MGVFHAAPDHDRRGECGFGDDRARLYAILDPRHLGDRDRRPLGQRRGRGADFLYRAERSGQVHLGRGDGYWAYGNACVHRDLEPELLAIIAQLRDVTRQRVDLLSELPAQMSQAKEPKMVQYVKLKGE